MYPSSEMLSEFKVSAINNNAELASSGDVTVTTKSGGNAIHGSAFEYLQNRALDATTYGSDVKQAKVWNTFGASLSGPVVIPKLYNGHNKTFFFVDYEGNRQVLGPRWSSITSPLRAMVAGNLNGVPGKPAVNPFTGAAISQQSNSRNLHQSGCPEASEPVLPAAQLQFWFDHRELPVAATLERIRPMGSTSGSINLSAANT